MSAKVTYPTKSLLQGMRYVNAASTDIRARFAAMNATENAKKLAEVTKPRLHNVKKAV